MTDNKKPLDDQNSAEEKTESIKQLAASLEKNNKKQSTSQAPDKTTRSAKINQMSQQNKISKTALLALFIALGSAAGVGGIHYLHSLQNTQQNHALERQFTEQIKASEQRITQLVNNQEALIEQQVALASTEIKQNSQQRILQLEQELNALKQNQPSDWLIHEAEYLVRIATRTLWLEHDTTAAINLLIDADQRIKELSHPQYLPVRQLIREDIEALKLIPVLKTEEVILTLLALGKQIPQLSFAMAKIPESETQELNLELSESTADWRSNISKTWQKFLADFITVRRRTGAVEPLMTPQYQANLKENLALKLQQAQWAVSKENSLLFTKTLDDIQLWLTEYFDMGHLETAQFYQGIQLVKNETISYNFPTKLSSLNALRQLLTDKPPLNKPDNLITPKKQESEQKKPSKLPTEAEHDNVKEQDKAVSEEA